MGRTIHAAFGLVDGEEVGARGADAVEALANGRIRGVQVTVEVIEGMALLDFGDSATAATAWSAISEMRSKPMNKPAP